MTIWWFIIIAANCHLFNEQMSQTIVCKLIKVHIHWSKLNIASRNAFVANCVVCVCVCGSALGICPCPFDLHIKRNNMQTECAKQPMQLASEIETSMSMSMLMPMCALYRHSALVLTKRVEGNSRSLAFCVHCNHRVTVDATITTVIVSQWKLVLFSVYFFSPIQFTLFATSFDFLCLQSAETTPYTLKHRSVRRKQIKIANCNDEYVNERERLQWRTIRNAIWEIAIEDGRHLVTLNAQTHLPSSSSSAFAAIGDVRPIIWKACTHASTCRVRWI